MSPGMIVSSMDPDGISYGTNMNKRNPIVMSATTATIAMRLKMDPTKLFDPC